MRRTRAVLALAVLGLACVAGARIVARVDHRTSKVTSQRETPSEQSGPTSELPPPPAPSAPLPPAPPRRTPPPAPDPAAAMRDVLSWQAPGARIDAIEAAIDAGDVAALPVLEKVVLSSDPEGAPTIIRAVASLGARAGVAETHAAAQTLSRWLEAESGRDGLDARGNVSVLVDALGDLGGADSAQALASALDQGSLPLHVQTLAVQRLAQLGDTSASDAIARFAARIAALPPAEGIDESLREEALTVASNATPQP